MSTRSFICYEEEGSLRGIYCHYDGYPKHVGKILVEHYNSITACEQIVDGGSHIRAFDHDGTISRFGEGDGEAESFLAVQDALKNGYDYVYLFSEQDNCWKCYGRDVGVTMTEFQIPGNRPFDR